MSGSEDPTSPSLSEIDDVEMSGIGSTSKSTKRNRGSESRSGSAEPSQKETSMAKKPRGEEHDTIRYPSESPQPSTPKLHTAPTEEATETHRTIHAISQLSHVDLITHLHKKGLSDRLSAKLPEPLTGATYISSFPTMSLEALTKAIGINLGDTMILEVSPLLEAAQADSSLPQYFNGKSPSPYLAVD